MALRAMMRIAGLAALLLFGVAPASGAPFMVVGNDEKVAWDAEGKLVLSPPGRDSIVIVDIAEPENPRVVATLPLKNSVVGPPVNLAIDPTNSIALVADSVDIVKEAEVYRRHFCSVASERGHVGGTMTSASVVYAA
jgi:hypothetical protein